MTRPGRMRWDGAVVAIGTFLTLCLLAMILSCVDLQTVVEEIRWWMR